MKRWMLGAACALAGWFAAAPGMGQEKAQWVRVGLEWHRLPPPVTDVSRAASQMEKGCGTDGAIRFGETASLRGQGPAPDWPREVRNRVAAASISDSYNAADRWLRDALKIPGLSQEARAVISNRRILTALQFGERAMARTLLAKMLPQDGALQHMHADRALWSVLLAADAARPAAWRNELLPLLDTGFSQDATSFSLRAWRVIGWLEARPWESGAACSALLRDFSNRLLDLSEAGACPLMMGHMSFAVDRHFGRLGPAGRRGEMGAWRAFADGLYSMLVRDGEALATERERLSTLRGESHCAQALQAELDILARRVGG